MRIPLGLDVGELIFVSAVLAILAMALFFVFCRRYEDGLIGNAALTLGVAIPCGLLLWDVLRGNLEVPAPSYCLLVVGVAIFMLRHGFRFAMFHWHGKYSWLRPRDRDVDATVPLGRTR